MNKTPALAAVALACALACAPAAADERESLEQLRATTLQLINALVETGAITRDKANTLIEAARPRAQWGDAPRPGQAAATPPAVRVPYISETVRGQIRDEVRQEVLAQAKAERWTDPAKMPEWLDRVSLYGDVRARWQAERFSADNTAPADYDLSLQRNSSLATRWAELADSGRTAGNTQSDTSTLRLRARLGAEVKLSADTTADLRIATGSSASATSTNITLGSNLAKSNLWLDRAVIRHRLQPWLALNAGRMGSPFETSDLVWDEDVNFDGVALRAAAPDALGAGPYAVLGAFPLQTASHPARPKGSWLYGAQIGTNWDASPRTRLKAALALYDFQGIEGVKESDSRLDSVLLTPNVADYAASSYASALRRKGNTLFRVNAPADTSATTWGLASQFRVLHLSLGAELWNFTPLMLGTYLDWVKNTAYDRAEIAARTGLAIDDGRADGWQLRLALGMPQLRNRGDWSASLAWRQIGSDAMVDGFTDSDFGLGGTNHKGWVLGGQYAIDARTTFGLKLMSARSLASPTMRSADHGFAVDVLQADLQVRF